MLAKDSWTPRQSRRSKRFRNDTAENQSSLIKIVVNF